MPLGINDNIFKPVIEKKSIRLLNKVPIDKKIILFSTSDIMEKRKGFDYLLKSLVNIEINKNLFSKELILITFGVLNKEINFKNIRHMHFPYTASVEKRVEIYNLADIFICTSIEDSGPSTLTEVMSCGIPVVAFDTGDAQKYIVNDHNGYKVRLKDVTDLENKIYKIFSLKKAEIDLFSKNSRNFVQSNLNKDKQLKIFKDIILSKNE
jgi:glycosyltransferase involved in cell wall biosynthesis